MSWPVAGRHSDKVIGVVSAGSTRYRAGFGVHSTASGAQSLADMMLFCEGLKLMSRDQLEKLGKYCARM